MRKDLTHMSNKEIDTLMNRYYSGESITKLIKEYGLSVYPSDLYHLFPPVICNGYKCDYCGSTLLINRKSRSHKNEDLNPKELYCPVCGHRPFDDRCNCEKCQQAAINLENERSQLIKEYYSVPEDKVNFNDVSFECKVYLGALCKANLYENMFEIAPREEVNNVLAPTEKLNKEIYDTLCHRNIITVSPKSPINAFVLDKNFPKSFYTYKVIYNLNLQIPSNKDDLFAEIFNPNYYTKNNKSEAIALWKKIAVAECIEYLVYQLNKVNFNFSPGDKTYKTFDIILNDFSVSQIYGIIWRAVADASKLYLEKGMSKRHAANSTISACERYADRAKMKNWQLTDYKRVYDLPQSILSEYYFYKVLKIGDMGFKIPPTEV